MSADSVNVGGVFIPLLVQYNSGVVLQFLLMYSCFPTLKHQLKTFKILLFLVMAN